MDTKFKNRIDRRAAVTEVTRLWEAVGQNGGHGQTKVLSPLIDAYQELHHTGRSPDAVDAILFRMEQLGLIKRNGDS